jgi:hypothetical protein
MQLKSVYPAHPQAPYPVHVVLCYKNFAASFGISHIGLGVAALNVAKILIRHGIKASVIPIVNVQALDAFLAKDSTVTHVEIAAPWIASKDIQALTYKYHMVKFAVNCHSNVGFLQADTNGVKLMREYLDIELGSLNFNVAGNSLKFIQWLRAAYAAPCVYLPNMYYLDYAVNANKPVYSGGTLRIGAFGATRPQKNLMSAAGVALELHEDLKVDTEFWVSGGRKEGGGNTILNSVIAMTQGIPGFTLKELNWATWPQFRDNVRKMHLLVQGSYTESFNMVTADGIAEGVPSVVSDAIDWAPDYWKASSDNVSDMARVGRQLIFDPGAPYDGMQHLEHHNADSFFAWTEWLGLVHDIEYISQIRQSRWK